MKKKLKLILTILISILIGCSSSNDETNNDQQQLAIVQTDAINNITTSTAISGGIISSDGNSLITEKGVCWSTSPNPTIVNSYTSDGNGSNSFTSNLSSLAENTTYYVRAYVKNGVGISYGNELSFASQVNSSSELVIDIDGNEYSTVSIGNQLWMQKNLNVSKYRNGDIIPQVTNSSQWTSLTTGAWCYYENNTSNGIVYGKLYNWYAVNDPRGLAPIGYHIPNDAEWTTLTNFLGGEAIAGGKMKSINNWNNPNTGATNISGFTGLPGGIRSYDGTFNFNTIGDYGSWWSSSLDPFNFSRYRLLKYNSLDIESGGGDNRSGQSVRCIKD